MRYRNLIEEAQPEPPTPHVNIIAGDVCHENRAPARRRPKQPRQADAEQCRQLRAGDRRCRLDVPIFVGQFREVCSFPERRETCVHVARVLDGLGRFERRDRSTEGGPSLA